MPMRKPALSYSLTHLVPPHLSFSNLIINHKRLNFEADEKKNSVHP